MPQTIFITGCSSGIGLATAKLFHEKGWNVVATMRTPEKDTELSSLNSPRLILVKLDVERSETIAPAVQIAIATFGSIDLLVNNAGFSQGGLFETLSDEQIQTQFDVNVFGMMKVTRAVLPHLRANPNDGRTGIINISSGAGILTYPLLSMYSASKFALEGFTEALSYELYSQNIYVKNIIPTSGVSATNFTSHVGEVFATPRDPELASAYGGFIQKTGEGFAKMSAGSGVSSGDVAGVVFEAGTDGKDKFRYLVGGDVGGFFKGRCDPEAEKNYMNAMRLFSQ